MSCARATRCGAAARRQVARARRADSASAAWASSRTPGSSENAGRWSKLERGERPQLSVTSKDFPSGRRSAGPPVDDAAEGLVLAVVREVRIAGGAADIIAVGAGDGERADAAVGGGLDLRAMAVGARVKAREWWLRRARARSEMRAAVSSDEAGGCSPRTRRPRPRQGCGSRARRSRSGARRRRPSRPPG